jgi:hypothetical protein
MEKRIVSFSCKFTKQKGQMGLAFLMKFGWFTLSSETFVCMGAYEMIEYSSS